MHHLGCRFIVTHRAFGAGLIGQSAAGPCSCGCSVVEWELLRCHYHACRYCPILCLQIQIRQRHAADRLDEFGMFAEHGLIVYLFAGTFTGILPCLSVFVLGSFSSSLVSVHHVFDQTASSVRFGQHDCDLPRLRFFAASLVVAFLSTGVGVSLSVFVFGSFSSSSDNTVHHVLCQLV